MNNNTKTKVYEEFGVFVVCNFVEIGMLLIAACGGLPEYN